MGVEVVVGGANEDELARIGLLFERWERVFSRFRAVSELNRVNGDPASVVVVSELFASVLRNALGAAGATDGLVDPSLGRASRPLATTAISRCSPTTDRSVRLPGRWRSLVLADRVLLRPPGVELDLNGVVKALAVDAALRDLRRRLRVRRR
jgi:thiamine biosynthesis lipoprotein